MLATLLRSRVRSVLALAVCAPLLLTIHVATPVHAQTQTTALCQFSLCYEAHATFIVPCGVAVAVAPNGFLYLTDLTGAPLAAGATDCNGNPAVVTVIPNPGYILTTVGFDGKLHPVSGPSVMLPGIFYAVTMFTDPNCVCTP